MLCRPYSRLDLHVIVSPIACLLLVNRRPQNLKDKKAEEKAKLFPPGRSSLPQGEKKSKNCHSPKEQFLTNSFTPTEKGRGHYDKFKKSFRNIERVLLACLS